MPDLGLRPRVLAALVIRECAARFGRSWGGYLWAVAEPLFGILLLSVAFSFIMHAPPLGQSFALFYATGLLPFLMYTSAAAGGMNAPSANRGLLVYPVVMPLDCALARCALETMTHVLVAAAFLPLLVWHEGVDPVIDPAWIAVSVGLAFALGLGVGTANAVAVAFWPSWRSVWAALNRPLFIVSGVLFPLDSVPRDLQPVIWLNPVTHVIAPMRAAFYGADQVDLPGVLYTGLVAAALFVVSGLILARNPARIAQG